MTLLPAWVAKKHHGTSLIEILAVVTIMAVVIAGTAVSVSNIVGRANKQTFTNDIESIQALIIKGRAYAKANRYSDSWGIKELIANATGCKTTASANCFVLFKGKDYATRNSEYDEVVTFNSNLGRWDDTNNDSEFYWQKVTGWARGLDNASSSDATAFRFRTSDGSYDCSIRVGIFGVVNNTCE